MRWSTPHAPNAWDWSPRWWRTSSFLVRALELAQQIAEVPGPIMSGLKEIYTLGADPVITPALDAEQQIAGTQQRDFAGLGDRYRAVAERNHAQIQR
ncbi:hypothetical protein MSMEI_2002 [Mycolicibacterium smegmatis MC2 155]|uniref:Uncharacterized protein n=1 Tax=Mycolicibacterium smegmatis (strain ATCC 700084 / mc(2)155) TaxID=246196 RepID=I7FI65_MYCS2|nr:hypothetical protein MSMEI_2002 [Mycolicibacterium smegmatis MC2 155]